MNGDAVMNLLRRTRRRLQWCAVLRAAALALTLWLAAAGAALALDVRLSFNATTLTIVRATLAVLGGAALIALLVAWRSARMTLPGVARLLERQLGHGENVLVNAACFRFEAAPGSSAALIDVALQRGDALAAASHPGAAVSWWPAVRTVTAPAAVLLLLLAAWLAWPGPFHAAALRLTPALWEWSKPALDETPLLVPRSAALLVPALQAEVQAWMNEQGTLLAAAEADDAPAAAMSAQADAADALALRLQREAAQPLAGDLVELLSGQAETLRRLAAGEGEGSGHGADIGEAQRLLEQTRRRLTPHRDAPTNPPLDWHGSTVETIDRAAQAHEDPAGPLLSGVPLRYRSQVEAYFHRLAEPERPAP